jgi:hypothetical protein
MEDNRRPHDDKWCLHCAASKNVDLYKCCDYRPKYDPENLIKVYFCSEACEKADFSTHKDECKRFFAISLDMPDDRQGTEGPIGCECPQCARFCEGCDVCLSQ